MPDGSITLDAVDDRRLESDAAALLLDQTRREEAERVEEARRVRLDRARHLGRADDRVADAWATILGRAALAAVVGFFGGLALARASR